MSDWKPRYLVKKAPHVGGLPIPDDEPVLVIRAQDVLAISMMLTYINAYKRRDGHSSEVLDQLNDHLEALRAWRLNNADRIKMADR